MASRQDQLHSYQFLTQRVVSALVMRETDPTRSPFRRAGGATLASVLIAAIGVGAAAVYGLLAGAGSGDWRAGDAVIVDRDRGARYVWVDDTLHPVRNYASALLIVGSATPRTVTVTRGALAGVPRGAWLGVPDAPDDLPAPGDLSTAAWSLCSTVPDPAGGPAPHDDGDASAARSVLLVGAVADGGVALSQDEALLVRDPAGERHLIFQQRRHRVRDAEVVLPALGWAGQRPVPVAAALVNALEAGADLGRIVVPHRGEASAAVPRLTVGQVVVARNRSGEEQYALVLRDGLAPITQVQAELVLTDPRTAELVGGAEPVPVTQADLAALPQLPPSAVDGAALPARPPALVPAATDVVCAVVPDDGGVAVVYAGGAGPAVVAVPRTAGRSGTGAALADHVVVPPGRGVVVESVAAPGAAGGAVSLVVEPGVRYAVPGSQVLSMLGYGAVTPVRLPAELVSLVPAGPALDPERARLPTLPG